MINRRDFIKNMALFGGAAALSPRIFAGAASAPTLDPNALRIGVIGCGNRGEHNMNTFGERLGQHIAAICDTDLNQCSKAKEKYASAQVFRDYREMLVKMEGKLDAVVISTPDLSHYAAAMSAVNSGLHIYIEKPFCHTIWQGRDLYKAIQKKGVLVQMGNQSHSAEGIRYCAEWIKAGLIGKVKEVILWTDRPLGGATFPNNVTNFPQAESVPSWLEWDLWQNVAAPQEYFGNRLTQGKWRGWWKYGSGALGDIGCHMLDIPVYALGLPYPSQIVSKTRGVTAISVASQEAVEYTFAKSNQGNPVKVTWYSGFKRPNESGAWDKGYDTKLLPPLPKQYIESGGEYAKLATNGQFLIGDKGVIYCPNMHQKGRPILLPRELWDDVKKNLPRTEERIKNNDHGLNFVRAVKGEDKLSSAPDYAHVLTEVVQLGNLASRTNAKIVWDAKNLVCVGNTAATKFVNPPMRKGWF